jgi:hypothetical protein
MRRWRNRHRSQKVSVMPDELRPDLGFAMSDAVDKLLLSWEPAPDRLVLRFSGR